MFRTYLLLKLRYSSAVSMSAEKLIALSKLFLGTIVIEEISKYSSILGNFDFEFHCYFATMS